MFLPRITWFKFADTKDAFLVLTKKREVCVCVLFRATPVAYGGSQARVLIKAAAAGLRHSHSNAGSEPRLQPTPQLMATPDR